MKGGAIHQTGLIPEVRNTPSFLTHDSPDRIPRQRESLRVNHLDLG